MIASHQLLHLALLTEMMCASEMARRRLPCVTYLVPGRGASRDVPLALCKWFSAFEASHRKVHSVQVLPRPTPTGYKSCTLCFSFPELVSGCVGSGTPVLEVPMHTPAVLPSVVSFWSAESRQKPANAATTRYMRH